MKSFYAPCFILLFSAFFAVAQNTPMKIGEEFDLKISTAHPYISNQNKQPVFEERFYSEGASYVKIHFENFQLAPGDYVSVSNAETGQEFIYAGEGVSPDGGQTFLSDFWSYSIFSDYAVVRLYSNGVKTAYGFDINRVAYGFPLDQIQESINASVCGNDDKEEIVCYNGTLMFDKGEAVCRLVIGGSGLCTGWLIGSEGHVMTNNHCVSTQNTASNIEFQFNYRTSNCAGTSNATTDAVAQTSTLICTDGTLDYTLLKLPVNPTNTYGFLSFRSSGPVVNERIYIPQHPGGARKKISVNDDQSPTGFAQVVNINGGGNSTRTEYLSDTDNGSSGSPVLSYNDHLVVALHNTGGCFNGGNRADAIVADMGTCLPASGIDNPGNIVLADFSVNTEKSCDGNIDFTNQSFNAVNFTWSFGDGTGSILENPSHSYSNAGTFDVQLIVEDSLGLKDTSTMQVYVAIASSPSVNSDTICANNAAQLTATGSGGTLYWYNTPSGGTPIDSGVAFTSPVLNSSTSFFVEEVESTPIENLGPVNNNISAGQYFTSNDLWGCYFDVELALTLRSVKVYSGSAGNRNIVLEQNGNTIESATINIPAGESRVNLNFVINPGTQYLLKVDGNVDLYRNSGGANYPYTIPGLISITRNNTTSGNADNYYYYFYDWEVQELPCVSPRTQVDVLVTSPPSISETVIDANCQGGSGGSIQLTPTGSSQNLTYEWSNGLTGSFINNLQPGTYSYTVSAGINCESLGTVTVGSGGGQLPQINASVQDETCTGDANGSVQLSVSNVSGNETYLWSNGDTTQNIYNLEPGIYSVTVYDNNSCANSITAQVDQGRIYPVFSADVQLVSCNGSSDGTISIYPTDSIQQYSYDWSNGEVGSSLIGLDPDTYYLTASNAGCSTIDSFVISEPTTINASLQVDSLNAVNCGAAVEVVVSGGNAPYTYSWSHDSQNTTESSSDLCTGSTYLVTVTDQNSCEKILQVSFGSQTSTNISDQPLLYEIKLYPNPVSNHLLLDVPEALLDKPIQLEIYDVLGKSLYKEVLAGRNNYNITMGFLASGSYYLVLRMDAEFKTHKINVIK